MDTIRTRYRSLTAACALVVIATGAVLVWRYSSRPNPKLVYTRNGFGGYTTAPEKRKSNDPLQPALDAYNAGKYDHAEAEARRTIASASKSSDPKVKRHVSTHCMSNPVIYELAPDTNACSHEFLYHPMTISHNVHYD